MLGAGCAWVAAGKTYKLQPEYVAILIGINDIARNNGYISVENAFKNLVSVVELCQHNGIKPIMCTPCPLPPRRRPPQSRGL